MEVKGSQKIKASRSQVFEALLNAEVLKNSIPGCELAEYEDFPSGRQLKLTVSPSMPGLKGPYTFYVEPKDVVEPSHVVLVTEPSNSLGSIKATCAVDLAEDGGATELTYNAQATIEGKLAATPEIILKPAIKVALDQFFKSFEKQVASILA